MLRLVEPVRAPAVRKIVDDETRARVLAYLMAHRSARRSEIARSLSISRSVVAEAMTQLQHAGIVKQTATRHEGGVRHRAFGLNRFGAGSVGLELGHRAIIGVLTSVDGTVLARQSVTVEQMTPAAISAASIDLIGDLLHEGQFDVNCLVGIGMAIPDEPQDLVHGPLRLADRDCWAAIDAESYFSAQFELPVTIGRPVEMAAGAEATRLPLDAVTGVLHFGAEIDLMGVLANGTILPNRGLVASRRGVDADGKLALGEGETSLSKIAGIPSMNAALGAANRSADVERLVQWVDQAAGPLTDLLVELSLQVNPEQVILSGAVPRVLREALSVELTARVQEADLGLTTDVICGEAGRFAAAEGAAQEMLQHQMLRATA
ncbi:MAG: hypothetical protein AAGK98_08455 [Pseudomonadota bacterium]